MEGERENGRDGSGHGMEWGRERERRKGREREERGYSPQALIPGAATAHPYIKPPSSEGPVIHFITSGCLWGALLLSE